MLQKEHSAILSTFIKLPIAIKTFVLSICKWPLNTGFTLNLTSMECYSEVCSLLSSGSTQKVS